ncbi:glutamate receptor 2-like [Pecten maximus]|uniref:glutamate receptor 2-like n=1 Tax=Pecten maximus TaxID=6579 RepID=UPI00145846AD|nr:glutamate receptor 2-like [Pecten maximus]
MRHMPSAFSGRVLVCSSLFFTLILVSMYSASLVPFVSSKSSSIALPFSTFRGLTMQTEYSYGAMRGGAVYQYFMYSKGDTERKIAAYLRGNPSNFVRNTAEGVKRAQQGKYAYIVESSLAYHAVSKFCDLMVIGDQLEERTYNFACRQNTNICDQLNTAILQLKINGVMNELKTKWWSGKCGVFPIKLMSASDDVVDARGKPIDMIRFTVPLVLLVAGIVLSIVMLLVEIFFPKVAKLLYTQRKSDVTHGFSGHMHTSSDWTDT